MSCHPKCLNRYADHIRRDPGAADFWLDQWIDATTRASEWDADQWGFGPDTWMATERAEMEYRIQSEKAST